MCFFMVLATAAQVQIPGMLSSVPILNDRILDPSNIYAVTGPLLSDTGDMVFGVDNTTSRAPRFRQGGPAGWEDLFFFRQNGVARSLTTSQSSHVHPDGDIQGLLRKGYTRGFCSPGNETVLMSTPLNDGSLRLSVVRLAERGEYPNTDYEIRDVGDKNVMAVAARWIDSKPVWFIRFWKRESDGQIDRCEVNGQQVVRTRVRIISADMSMPEEFEPETGAVISAPYGTGNFDYLAPGSNTVQHLQAPQNELGRLFLWRGGVYYTTKTFTYKLAMGGDWEVFCPYQVLARSANGKYWAVRDGRGQAFLVEF